MASADNITVTVEMAIHDFLAEYAKHVMREHGIKINYVRFDWIGGTEISADPFKAILTGVTIESKTGVKR